jgi:uncharacterized repeat protein (TIGR01451 family)
VVLTDTLPGGASFVSATPSQGTCDSTVSCNLGTIVSGSAATITLVVQVNGASRDGTITNTAFVTSSTADPDPSDNSASATTTVQLPPQPVADLSVTKTDSPDPVPAGTDLTYTITVTNNGPAGADSAVLTDTVPDGTTLVSVVPGAGSCTGTPTITCDLGPLAVGMSVVVTLVVHVDGGLAPGTEITNTASVGPSRLPPTRAVGVASVDPDPGNDEATAVTTVAAPSTGPAPGSPAEPGAAAAPGAAAESGASTGRSGLAAPARAGTSPAARAVVARPTYTG